MKNLLNLLSLTILIYGSCKKGASIQNLETCNLTGDLLSVNNIEGTVFYTDTLPGFKFPKPDIYIINSKLDSIYLPLLVCNFPKENFESISLGDSLQVRFSGKILLLPPTVDAANLNLELTKIESLNP